MLILFFSLWLLVILGLSFWNLKWGVVLFLVYMVLVPYMKLKLGAIEFGQNLFYFSFLLSYFVYAKRKKVKTNWKPLVPFFIYFISTLCVMPFQSDVPVGVMFNSWRVDIMSTLFLPFVIWNVAINEPSSVKLFRNAMLLSITIAVGYCLCLTTMGDLNPYIMLMLEYVDADKVEYYESYFEAEDGGRIFGRISSVFIHPMTNALFLGLSFIYVYGCKKYMKKTICGVLMLAILVSSVVCGVRSVLGALVIVIAYYLFRNKNYKLMLSVVFIGVVGYLIIENIPALSSYLGSMADINNQNGDVNGSSFAMRIEQFSGALKECGKNPLFGLGYGWTMYYLGLNGSHPVCLSFESLIYVIICNFGLFGFVIWAYLIFKYLITNRKMRLRDNVLFDCLMVFYISFSCITGEYGYMKLFLIFYILMLCNQLHPNRKRLFRPRRRYLWFVKRKYE